jgi:hypothetical protein
MTLRIIHPIGKSPNAAPNPAEAKAIPGGIPSARIATATAEASPATAAQWARTWCIANNPSSTTSGSAATIVDRTVELCGS